MIKLTMCDTEPALAPMAPEMANCWEVFWSSSCFTAHWEIKESPAPESARALATSCLPDGASRMT